MRDAEKEAVLAKRHGRIGEFIDGLIEGVGVSDLPGGVLRSVKIRMPTEEDPSTLMVIRASTPGGEWVAFVGSYQPGDGVLAWRARVLGKGARWREFVPWEEREA